MVPTRTREIAVRMALGSTRLRVFALMLSDLVKLVIPGVAGGRRATIVQPMAAIRLE